MRGRPNSGLSRKLWKRSGGRTKKLPWRVKKPSMKLSLPSERLCSQCLSCRRKIGNDLSKQSWMKWRWKIWRAPTTKRPTAIGLRDFSTMRQMVPNERRLGLVALVPLGPLACKPVERSPLLRPSTTMLSRDLSRLHRKVLPHLINFPRPLNPTNNLIFLKIHSRMFASMFGMETSPNQMLLQHLLHHQLRFPRLRRSQTNSFITFPRHLLPPRT